jgi:hypothetical protein
MTQSTLAQQPAHAVTASLTKRPNRKMTAMSSFMEILYIDSEDLARKTSMENAAGSNAETLARFRSFRIYAVDIKTARFLLDYHNAKGDLSDTIPLDERGFAAITGQRPKSDAEYQKIDTQYWNDVRASTKAAA